VNKDSEIVLLERYESVGCEDLGASRGIVKDEARGWEQGGLVELSTSFLGSNLECPRALQLQPPFFPKLATNIALARLALELQE
jgi:hypothetical protein